MRSRRRTISRSARHRTSATSSAAPSAGRCCATSCSSSPAMRVCARRKGEVQFANPPEPGVADRRLLRRLDAILDPLTGLPFAGNRIPPVADYAVRGAPAAQRSRREPDGRQQLPRRPRLHRQHRHGDGTRRSRPEHARTRSFARYIWYDSQQSLPSAITDGGRPQTGKNLAVGHTWVISPARRQRDPLRLQLLVPRPDNSLAGEDYPARNWVARRRPAQPLGSANATTTGGPARPSPASAASPRPASAPTRE